MISGQGGVKVILFINVPNTKSIKDKYGPSQECTFVTHQGVKEGPRPALESEGPSLKVRELHEHFGDSTWLINMLWRYMLEKDLNDMPFYFIQL